LREALRLTARRKERFDSITDLASKLAATGYFIGAVMTQVVFLAAKLQKPLLLEGLRGAGTHAWNSSRPAAQRYPGQD
jgi:hypothetical protein